MEANNKQQISQPECHGCGETLKTDAIERNGECVVAIVCGCREEWVKGEAIPAIWRPVNESYLLEMVDNYEPRDNSEAWSGGFADNH